jgi:N-acetylmuramic acid 6-phosphate etherase
VTWQHVFRRPIKGLDWSKADYIRMKASQAIIDNPPALGSNEIEQYCIGNEADPSRYSRQPAKLVAIDINGSANCQLMNWFNEEVKHYDGGLIIRMGNIPDRKLNDNEIWIPVKLPRTITDLMTHLLVKLAFNLLSTATMAKMGRVWSNWMIQVFPSNKKLIDRSTRIISTLAKIPYEQACEEFFKSYLGRKPGEEYRESFVIETLRRLGFDPNAEIK